MVVRQPLVLTDHLNTFDIMVNVHGGGESGQAGAVRHGISRALVVYDATLKSALRKAGWSREMRARSSARRWACTRRDDASSSRSAKRVPGQSRWAAVVCGAGSAATDVPAGAHPYGKEAMIKVGIVGGTGYTGVELLRLLARIRRCGWRRSPRARKPGWRSPSCSRTCAAPSTLAFTDPQVPLWRCDVCSSPRRTASHAAGARAARRGRARHRPCGGFPHPRRRDLGTLVQDEARLPGSGRRDAVYGLPEVYREGSAGARLVGEPRLLSDGGSARFSAAARGRRRRSRPLIADAKSGVSGAGRKAEVHTLFAEASDNFKAYGVPGHRHLPEIAQGLRAMAGAASAGLRAAPHADDPRYPRDAVRAADRRSTCRRSTSSATPASRSSTSCRRAHPDTRSVRGANVCRIAVHRPQGRDIVVVLSVIDNLVKGAAGQAVQNMNINVRPAGNAGLDHLALLP